MLIKCGENTNHPQIPASQAFWADLISPSTKMESEEIKEGKEGGRKRVGVFQAAQRKLLQATAAEAYRPPTLRLHWGPPVRASAPSAPIARPQIQALAQTAAANQAWSHMGHQPVDDTCREEQFQQVWGTTADNQTLLRGGWRAARVCKCSQSCLVFSIFLSARLVPTDRRPAGQTPPQLPGRPDVL